ncbi:hypothetical protein QC764_0048440 [Podospora pseudoanserina]|uniref:Uncharacterized protein n=1 Tax=Podospora pseudoanserina TaxID=2609844 RepID=A0ABR0ICB0_9PEZI|nr:hypothetical protein QC764_0048440 [Podospora pseudoanserina]
MVEQFLAQVVRMLEPWLGLPQRAAHFTSNLNFHLRFSLRVFFLFHFQPSVSVAWSPCIHLTSSDLPDTATYCTPSSYGGGLNYTRASGRVSRLRHKHVSRLAMSPVHTCRKRDG